MFTKSSFNDYYICKDKNVAVILVNYKDEVIKCMVDANDITKLIEFGHRWFILKQPKKKTAYVVANNKRGTPMIRLHRFLLDAPHGMIVDHKDGNGLNNCKDNLRVCTVQENTQNQHGARADNKTSGIRNVCWDSARNRWMVRTANTFIGRYDDINEASVMAEASRRKLMPFSYT